MRASDGVKLMVFLLMQLIGLGVAVSAVHPRCERIAAPMCQGLGYNTTHMPNFLEHSTQQEALLELKKLSALFESKCSPFLRLFVCSLYIPLCSDHVPGAVPACKGLCEEVNRDCQDILLQNNFLQLNCTSFPEPPNLCMQHPPEDEILHNVLLDEQITYKCPANTFKVGTKCINVKTAFNPLSDDRTVAQSWILVWSVIALLMISFALLTFAMQPKRFRWPARPILYLTLSGMCSCIIYIVQWTLKRSVEEQRYDKWCLLLALTHTYFEFAFALWWSAFSYMWYLSASKEWSTEAIESVAPRTHSLVWSLSGVPIVYILVFSSVRPNSHTGYCQSYSLVLTMFQALIVLGGILLMALAWKGLQRVRSVLVDAGRSPYKLERLIYRLGVISLGISVPLLVTIFSYFADSFYFQLVGVCSRFLSIVFSTLWVFSYKTFRSWNKILKPRISIGKRPVTKV